MTSRLQGGEHRYGLHHRSRCEATIAEELRPRGIRDLRSSSTRLIVSTCRGATLWASSIIDDHARRASANPIPMAPDRRRGSNQSPRTRVARRTGMFVRKDPARDPASARPDGRRTWPGDRQPRWRSRRCRPDTHPAHRRSRARHTSLDEDDENTAHRLASISATHLIEHRDSSATRTVVGGATGVIKQSPGQVARCQRSSDRDGHRGGSTSRKRSLRPLAPASSNASIAEDPNSFDRARR